MKIIYGFIHSLMPDMVHEIINDTLKKPDDKGIWRWSRTSLTMFSAWITVLSMAIYDTYKNGLNETVFITLVGVALGSKMTDAISKKWGNTKGGTTTTPDSGTTA
jgi:hypothetical protein